MVSEDNDTPRGWPLGLWSMTMRLRVAESSRAAAPETYSLHKRSSSFSSILSSNLDTESTASFFQDRSVSLGRLIGVRPGNRGRFLNTNATRFEQHETLPHSRSYSRAPGTEASRGLCVPLLHNVMEKFSRSRSSSRH